MSIGSKDGIAERKCAVCRKTILMECPSAWNYIRKYGNKKKYFCSWKCYNKGAVKQEGDI